MCDSKAIYNVTKDSILNKISLHQRILKNKMYHSFYKNINLLSKLIIIIIIL